MKTLRLAGVCVAAAATVACGFTLRGAALLPKALEKTYLQAENLNLPLIEKLETELRRSGVELMTDAASATAVISILSDEAGERVLSVSARGEPQEYELYHTVVFTMRTTAGTVLNPVSLTLTRDYIFDEQDILGKSEDAEFLRDALAEEVARAIVSRAALAVRTATR